jgi:uncharacterized protein (TIGR02266 family)
MEVVHTTSEESYADGEVIFEEGSTGDWVYVVEEGAVELSKIVEGKKVIVEVLRKGQVFGEMAFLAQFPRTATAKALGETTLGIMDRVYLDSEFNKLSGDFKLMIRSLADRLRKTTDSMVGRANARAKPRINRTLSLTFKDKDTLVKAYTHNVSGSGLFIKTPKPLAKGETFNLRLSLPGSDDPMELACQVVWVRTETTNPVHRPVGMGVKFTDITSQEQTKIEKAAEPDM